ncbi:RNA-binding protein with multiple splicing [Phtheirospermum japonicum]|uniref:RNA-binding protein with multiple splicing n=1 Tax=Phtheirospermum japonicum TaxID=374723 RepID=A0A830B422_9LAMI|nr:RNA-binding protein with multiple splicing [Phtheirospermum japonicum]
MDDLSAYYAPSIHHTYYQPPPPPPPPGTAYPPPATVAQPIYVPPQFVGYAPSIYPQSPEDQVRTLFVAGLPEDVKPREIYHLFRECPGYQSSNLRPPTSSNNQPFAFATFVDQQSAIMALHAINGMVFDLEKGSTLHIDLAKSNSRSKRVRGDDGSQGSEKRLKGSSPFLWNDDPGYGSVHTPGMANPAYNTIAYPSTQRSSAHYLCTFILLESDYSNMLLESHINCVIRAERSRGKQKAVANRNLPCSLNVRNVDSGSAKGVSTKSKGMPCPTLFVANLGPTCSDEELTQVFSRCRGFLKLKMQGTYGAPVAFVDFKVC